MISPNLLPGRTLRRKTSSTTLDDISGVVPAVVVIVTRSPVGYALSARGATGASASEAAQWWRDVYVDAVRTVNRLSLPMVVVRNEDVRSQPNKVLAMFASLLDQPVPPRLRPPVTAHTLGGNLWVHNGYSGGTWELHEALGFSSRLENHWGAEDWKAAATRGSAGELLRPRTKQEAIDLIEALFDCPGLVDIANLLGYQLGSEVARVLNSDD